MLPTRADDARRKLSNEKSQGPRRRRARRSRAVRGDRPRLLQFAHRLPEGDGPARQGALGRRPQFHEHPAADPDQRDHRVTHMAYDVIVIGGGNAAMCAALSAREHGARVLVLEKAPEAWRGGNGFFTPGGFPFAFQGFEEPWGPGGDP